MVTLQYIAPILMCLYFALMYKTLGGYNWSDLFRANATGEAERFATEQAAIVDSAEEFDEMEKDIFTSAKELHSSFQGLKAVWHSMLKQYL